MMCNVIHMIYIASLSRTEKILKDISKLALEVSNGSPLNPKYWYRFYNILLEEHPKICADSYKESPELS